MIALAPGHAPEARSMTKLVGADVQEAKALIAGGKGKVQRRFTDTNQGQTYSIMTTPEIYFSWFNPEGSAVMPRSAASFTTPIPLLVVVGNHDRLARGKDYIFDKAPPHPKSRFASVSAGHVEVPGAALDEVLGWLASLEQ